MNLKSEIKSVFMVLILAGFTAQYATAENFNQEEMAFGDSVAVASYFGQMDLLSSQEMMETEGEWIWFIGVSLRFTTNPWVRHYASNFGLGYGVYTWAKSMHDRYR